MTIETFAALLGPLPDAVFIEHFRAKQRVHVAAAAPERAEALLPWSTVEWLIESDLVPPDQLKLRRAAGEIPATMYRTADGSINADAVDTILRQGTSLILDRVDSLVPGVGQLARAIERRLGCKVWANAYLTFGRGGAFKPHFDPHDVVVVQVRGRKHWRSYGASEPYPVHAHATERHGQAIWEAVLEPGDMLYMPRGEIHDAAVRDETSVHISFGLLPPRGLDWLAHLAREAESDARFRMDVPRFGDADALRRHEAELKNALHALIDRSSLADLLHGDDQRRSRPGFVDLAPGGRLAADTVLRATPRRRGGVFAGRGGDPLSPLAQRLLALLLERDALTVGALHAQLSADVDETALHGAVTELRDARLLRYA